MCIYLYNIEYIDITMLGIHCLQVPCCLTGRTCGGSCMARVAWISIYDVSFSGKLDLTQVTTKKTV